MFGSENSLDMSS
uniref:Uncharacterized protein n=1 Tax=Lepeophtheirus salmonis TaxID=72036 RepID=A0A0K2VAQ9_LEPSM